MAQESTKPEATQKKETKPTEKQTQPPEKQTNCPTCGKPIKKLKRYYRNGKFYCNKNCWRKTLKTKEEKK